MSGQGAAVKEQREVAKIRGCSIPGSGNEICTVPASYFFHCLTLGMSLQPKPKSK